jgi:hypothetical protein
MGALETRLHLVALPEVADYTLALAGSAMESARSKEGAGEGELRWAFCTFEVGVDTQFQAGLMVGFVEDGLPPGMGNLLLDLVTLHGGDDQGCGTFGSKTRETLLRVEGSFFHLILEEVEDEDAHESDLATEVVRRKTEEGALLVFGVGIPVHALGVNLRTFVCIVSHGKSFSSDE